VIIGTSSRSACMESLTGRWQHGRRLEAKADEAQSAGELNANMLINADQQTSALPRQHAEHTAGHGQSWPASSADCRAPPRNGGAWTISQSQLVYRTPDACIARQKMARTPNQGVTLSVSQNEKSRRISNCTQSAA